MDDAKSSVVLLQQMSDAMSANSAFDKNDVRTVNDEVSRLQHVVALEQKNLNRTAECTSMITSLTSQLAERQRFLQDYETRGLQVSKLPLLHEFFCTRQAELYGTLQKVEDYAKTGQVTGAAWDPQSDPSRI